MKELPKIYDPKLVEDAIYKKWEGSGYFSPEKCEADSLTDPGKKPFSIVLPPPNVTGRLHTGHAAMLAIEDCMVRFARMQGRPTLWIPGTDHAAIATQSKVEKMLFEKEGKTRHDLGREIFLKKVEAFAQESHDVIVSQTKKMGSSLDWNREAYTLDSARSLAVRTAFKKMFDDGLIVRKDRVVNWCPRCFSTLSDDEVDHQEQTAKLYTFRYDKDFPIEISTTRPETKLGDTAIAVNPKDPRYSSFIGKTLSADFCGVKLSLKIIADSSVEVEFGTGALGVTPAHSMIDWQMAQKNDLPLIKVIGENGKILPGFGEYSGKTGLEARESIVKYLKQADLVSKEEESANNLSVCYRCGTAIEPLPSLQWFIDINKKFKHKWSENEISLKELMGYAVSSEKIGIIPERFNKTYFHWIENLQDWCISRQIWFGHRIPVWYRNDSQQNTEIYCGIEAPEGEGWRQDEDTLDTWFSSGLWTFSTLGWPQETEDFKKFHPTSVLETGYDILFFWVARMILLTSYLLEEVPFEKIYLHGLVRDEKGRKMSKSLGNIIDPLDVIEKYGTDSLRLSLMLGVAPGQDLKLGDEKIESYRNFTNKLWNISRYILQITENSTKSGQIKKEACTLADLWIIGEMEDLIKTVSEDLENHRFSLAGEKLEKFTWNTFADWYIEVSKFEENKEIKHSLLEKILADLLKLWHPFIPFVTEEIWGKMNKGRLLMAEKWPSSEKYTAIAGESKQSQVLFPLIQEIIVDIRNARIENGLDLKKKLDVVLDIKDVGNLGGSDALEFLSSQIPLMKNLRTGVGSITITKTGEKIENSIQRTVAGISICIPLAGLIDIEKETEKALKEIGNLKKFIAGLEARLSNKEFVSKAPQQIIQGQQESLAEAKAQLEAIKKHSENLK